MAPLLRRATQILLQLLPFSNGPLSRLDHKEEHSAQEPANFLAIQGTIPSLSAISIGVDRIDVYGASIASQSPNLLHRYWDGKGWMPQGKFELLGSPCYNPAIAVPIDSSRMDVYDINYDGNLWQKKWNGNAWLPSQSKFTPVSEQAVLDPSLAPSVTSCSTSRVDVFGTTANKPGVQNGVYHLIWDSVKKAWTPEFFSYTIPGSLSGPSAVCSAADRLFFFVITSDGEVIYQWWNGITWSSWMYLLGPPKFQGTPCAIAGPNTDYLVFATGVDGLVYMKSSADSVFAKWTNLGDATATTSGLKFLSVAAVKQPGTDIVELVALGTDKSYYYKWWNAGVWQPGALTWLPKGGGRFASAPTVTSWGVGRMDIFGIAQNGDLLHQYWANGTWTPGDQQYEVLGNGLKAF